jgi:hypothetical protein
MRFSWVVVLPGSRRVLSRILPLHDFRYALPWQPALDERERARMVSVKGAHVPDVLARPAQLEAGPPLRRAAGSLHHDRYELPRLHRRGQGQALPDPSQDRRSRPVPAVR